MIVTIWPHLIISGCDHLLTRIPMFIAMDICVRAFFTWSARSQNALLACGCASCSWNVNFFNCHWRRSSFISQSVCLSFRPRTVRCIHSSLASSSHMGLLMINVVKCIHDCELQSGRRIWFSWSSRLASRVHSQRRVRMDRTMQCLEISVTIFCSHSFVACSCRHFSLCRSNEKCLHSNAFNWDCAKEFPYRKVVLKKLVVRKVIYITSLITFFI